MKNTIDPKKAIAVICAVSVFIVGGCILGRHIIGGEEDSEVAAVTSPSPSASPSSAPGYSIDTAYDGIVGKETATPAPSSVPEPPQNSPAAETKAPAAPAGTKSGSGSGASAPSGTNSGTASKPAKTAPSSDQSSGDSSGSSTPAGGSTNSSGQKYVPGFGYITPGSGSGEISSSDGDWNKQVGTMG